MKKIFFAGLMLLALGGVMNAQTPVKSTTSQKKTVSSVTPVNTTKKNTAVAKTTAKPAATSSASKPAVPTSAIGKHKKARKTAKKAK